VVARIAGGPAARYGGEEFALLLPRTTLREARLPSDACCRRRGRYPARRFALGPRHAEHRGCAGGPAAAAAGPDELVADADHALYLAKARGRHRVACFGDDATAPPRLVSG
jgi:PleD family two-component response regulator